MPDDKMSEAAVEDDQLEELFPAPTTIKIGRKVVTIYPPTLRQTGPLARLMRPARQADRLTWFDLMADHDEACIAAIAILTREPEEWIGNLRADLGKKLGLAVFNATAPFFVEPPSDQPDVEETATSPGLGDGATSSLSSSPAAT